MGTPTEEGTLKIAWKILVALGCLAIAGFLPLFVELLVIVLGGRVHYSVHLVLMMAGLSIGIWLMGIYVRLDAVRSAGDPVALAAANRAWRVRAYPAFGMIFVTILLAVATPPTKHPPRTAPTALDIRRLKEIPIEAIASDDEEFEWIRRELWEILDRGNIPPAEIDALRETVVPALRRLSLYWEDAHNTHRAGKVVESPERIRLEADLVDKGLLQRSSVARSRKDLEAIARREPIEVDGMYLNIDEKLIEDGIRGAARTRTRMETLFDRPPANTR